MGNQVKGNAMQGGFQYVKCHRLEANNKKETEVGKVEKIFGVVDSEGEKENIIEESCILYKESIAKCERQIGLRGAKHIVSEMQFPSIIQEKIQRAVTIITAKNSPIKREYELENAQNKTSSSSVRQRQRQHYFKLKGCHPDQ